jgi:hypothetical protein
MTACSQEPWPAGSDHPSPGVAQAFAAKHDIAVVHLVWAPLGLATLQRFLASYARHRAGLEHRLVILCNGFDGPHDRRLAEIDRALAAVEHERLSTPRPLLDLEAYRFAAATLQAHLLCFVNSFSEILHDDWLGRLAATLREPRIGAVAATGSWGSHASHMRYNLGLGGPYARVFPGREPTQRVFAALAGQPGAAQERPSAIAVALHTALTTARQTIGFAQFPAPHLRTNGLLIERERWLALCPAGALRDKLATHRLEGGRRSITARLRSDGLDVAIVGRDGRAYRGEDWPSSFTFWQGEQQNLLIADNQTRTYQEGDALRRRVLSAYAWGSRAAPLEPSAAVPA